MSPEQEERLVCAFESLAASQSQIAATGVNLHTVVLERVDAISGIADALTEMAEQMRGIARLYGDERDQAHTSAAK